MKKNRLFKSVVFVALLFGFMPAVRAQQSIDSSFHNYLFDNRTNYFRALPVVKKAIVFLGDSITDWGDWAEFTGFKKVLNRGIAGDNSFGLLARIDEVLRHSPSRIFILIGTNDININGEKAAIYVVNNYKRLIAAIRQKSPATKIYIQSVLPVNSDLINKQYYKGTNNLINELNGCLHQLASEIKVSYIDLHRVLLDDKGQLAKKYTYDGLHLSGEGYLTWVKELQKQRLL